MKLTSIASLCILCSSGSVFAGPFENCPSKAFLMQDSVAKLYGIDLVSAKATTIAASLTREGAANTSSVNAVGFNYKDQYMYGYSKQSPGSVVQIGDDYNMTELDVTGLPDTNFYVGDIQVTGTGASQEAFYFVYTPKFGLYKIPLNDDLTQTINSIHYTDSENWNLNIFDFAFHPNSNLLYAMESNGNLHEINVDNATTTLITQLDTSGDSGAFGAAYFDVNGQFYASNNKSGKIHKIDLSTSPVVGYTPTAAVFTSGPKSSQNDGARCAIAEVKVTDNSIDFGDAPNGYATTLADSGPRHLYDPNDDGQNLVYLGASVDGENINTAADLAAEPIDNSDDGVAFVTDFVGGQTTQVIVTASQNSYLYAWVDWNQDQVFSSDEVALDKVAINAGDNSLLIAVPETTLEGNTWARFRVTDGTEASNISATGGVSGGEVEDYEITTYASDAYPSESDWVTLSYEDKWPFAGDYDFNDLVMHFRSTRYKENGAIVGYRIEGEIVGVGATYHNGFAVRLYDQINASTQRRVARSEVDEANISFTIDGVVQENSPLEANRSDAIIIVMEDVWDYVQKNSGCQYFRTEANCQNGSKVTFSVTIPLLAPKALADSPANVLDPFIFASNDHFHGEFMNNVDKRGWEVHLKNRAPTEAFAQSLYNVSGSDDASNPAGNTYFQTASGLPWAMEIGSAWQHPIENIDITNAYSKFAAFATSAGKNSITWYSEPQLSKVITSGAQ
ncbi:LruC domain-containing protein [Pseudoalteromonas sp. MMG005]|uniref:LruC domain-containing protein n=1 Tax=Pseudoalteromonas sp. MMG005 TaxID=2822682 RepID=UPI001B3A6B9D|nr:LruC domain-containing protein [Pseudoalteromonas sp. MMG005]MBQ4845405.1 LruC domain-containing protein [Pseudoalteromonas sp. MMG005]